LVLKERQADRLQQGGQIPMVWYWGLSVLMTVIFWGLIIWAVVALFGWARRNRRGPAGRWHGAWPWGGGMGPWGGPGPARDDDPEQILARRFAAGEIDEEEYRRRLEALRSRQYADTAGRS
jgi:putative membrane protein